jgi:RNA polymerase sigma factor (sigma-70 family)
MAVQDRPLDTLSDEELAALCVQRPINQDAWEAFYERFRDFVKHQVRRRLAKAAPELDDLTQEGFTKIFRVLPAYDPAKSQLKTYISHVITNLAIDYFRHNQAAKSNTVSLEDEIGMLQIQAAQNPEILRIAAEGIVSRLPDKERAELMLDLLHGKEVKEICAQRHLTEYRVYTARTWLRSQLHKISANFPEY